MPLSALFQLLALAALWGASFVFLRIAAPEFGAAPLIAVRAGVAALFLLPALLRTDVRSDFIKNIRTLFLLGFISTALPFSFIAYATLYATAGYCSILNALTPMFTALVAFVWLRDKLNLWRFIGIVIGFVGVVLLLNDKDSVDTAHPWLSAIFMMGATFSYAIAGCYTKTRVAHISPLATTVGSQLCAAIILLPLAMYQWPQVVPSPQAWAAAIAIGVLCSGIAFLLYFNLIKTVGVSKTVTVTYLIPLFSVLWATLFLNEVVTLHMLIGGGVILLGVALTTELIKQRAAPT